MFKLNLVKISGSEVLPIIEGGKGINVSTGVTAGNFAKSGAVGTFSAVNADSYDDEGNVISQVYDSKLSRKEKFDKLVKYAINGAIHQAKTAYDIASGNGRIHMNVLWEAGGASKILEAVLSKAKGLIHGVTSGAGMPYSLGEIASNNNVYYYPIVSSVRAFKILWKRSYIKFRDFFGGIVYEDPWLAGGHNGISNSEDPNIRQNPYLRIKGIRDFMTEIGLDDIPIILAGGVWNISEFSEYLNNKEIGKIAFQFGTRPLLTKESPISDSWKNYLFDIKEGDVSLNQFSPTGFYSSAIKNDFLKNLAFRSSTEIPVSRIKTDIFTEQIPSGNGITYFYIAKANLNKALDYIKSGLTRLVKTPDDSVVFLSNDEAMQIKKDQVSCMGCLSFCRFSGWSDKEPYSTGLYPDVRSFCIQKTLQDVSHGGNIQKNLLFAGHSVYRFAKDEFYKYKFIPTISQLVERIKIGK